MQAVQNWYNTFFPIQFSLGGVYKELAYFFMRVFIFHMLTQEAQI